MKSIEWKDNTKGNVKILIELMLDVRKEHKGQKGLPYGPKIVLILTEIAASISNYKLQEKELIPVIKNIDLTQKDVVRGFEKACLKYIKEKESSLVKKRESWRIYLPIETRIKEIELPIKLRVLNQDYYIVEEISAIKRIGKRKYDELIKRMQKWYTFNNSNRYYISTIAHNATKDEAWDRTIPSFDVLRGILEYSLNLGHWRLSLGGIFSSRQTISHPKFIIKYSKSKSDVHGFQIEHSSENVISDFDKKRYSRIRSYCNIFRNDTHESQIVMLLADSLRLYAQAMDQKLPHMCFMGLWQMAELLTLSRNFGGNTKTICKRLGMICHDPNYSNLNILSILGIYADKRNSIVHRGIHEVEEDDVNILKYYCEIAFNWLLQRRDDICTVTHLEYLYSIKNLTEEQINMREDIHKLL